jgi:hypothetical protein
MTSDHRLKPCTCCDDVERMTAQLNAACIQRDALQIDLGFLRADLTRLQGEKAALENRLARYEAMGDDDS